MTGGNENETPEMRTERIEISGGRYLIYYTFPGMEEHQNSTPISENTGTPSRPNDDDDE